MDVPRIPDSTDPFSKHCLRTIYIVLHGGTPFFQAPAVAHARFISPIFLFPTSSIEIEQWHLYVGAH